MPDMIKNEDMISIKAVQDYCRSKADHYRMRVNRIEAHGDAITYNPKQELDIWRDEIAIYESFAREIENLPSVASKQNAWIPCKQKLPEVGTSVLGCWDDGHMTIFTIHNVDDYAEWRQAYIENGLTAWMYLPEPYKA